MSEREKVVCAAAKAYADANPGGGALHIVLDDGNCEDGNIQWCIDNSIKEELDVEALALAQALLTINVDRRFDFYEANWEWVPKEPS